MEYGLLTDPHFKILNLLNRNVLLLNSKNDWDDYKRRCYDSQFPINQIKSLASDFAIKYIEIIDNSIFDSLTTS